MKRGYLFISLLCIVLLATACGRGGSPEDQVKRFVKAGEEAAEARDIGALKELISEEYADGRGRSRRDIVAIAARYLLSNRDIHILTRIGELVFSGPDRVDLVLFVAMTGRNVSDLDTLLNMRADLYRFDLRLAREGGHWRLAGADWREAGPEDFF
jgi:hypothetical protein